MKKALLIALAISCCAHADERITFTPHYGNGYPEGVAWHADKQAFLVSSLRGGALGLVGLDGSYRVFSADKRLLTSAGLAVDAARKRVLAVNTSPGVAHGDTDDKRQRTAQVFEFDMDTGELRHIYDFSGLSRGATLANDLTLDDQGNIYVTDSFQPNIYRANYADKSVSVFLSHSRLRPESKDETTGLLPNLNGIVYHPGGYLLASDYVRGKLWKIPLDKPGSFEEIRLPERLSGPDGLRLLSPDQLVAVQTAADAEGKMRSEVTFLRSTDAWTTATIEHTHLLDDVDGATTATLKNDELWIVNSHYPSLFAAPEKSDEAVQSFELIRVKSR